MSGCCINSNFGGFKISPPQAVTSTVFRWRFTAMLIAAGFPWNIWRPRICRSEGRERSRWRARQHRKTGKHWTAGTHILKNFAMPLLTVITSEEFCIGYSCIRIASYLILKNFALALLCLGSIISCHNLFVCLYL